jgi:preprotein translocase subunit SecD
MTKKDYVFYILFIFFIFVCGLIAWPNRFINIDAGDFHYHKEWTGFTLDQLTFGLLSNDLNIDLGKDFTGSNKYKVKVVFVQGEGEKEVKLNQTMELLRARLEQSGFVESSINYFKEVEDYYIYADIGGDAEERELVSSIFFLKGELGIWGEKSEEEMAMASQEQTEFDENDIFRSYLEQQYKDLGVDGNQIKGFQVGEEEESYYLKIVLQESQAEALQNQLMLFYGKSLIGVLDSQILALDGSDLSEQVRLGGISSLKFAGMNDEQSAKLFGSIIQNGPLPVSLEVSETNFQEVRLARPYISKVLKIGAIAIAVMAIVLIAFFKKDGVVMAVSVALFTMIFVAGLKLIPVRFSLGSIWAFLLSLSFLLAYFAKVLKEYLSGSRETEISVLFHADRSKTFMDTVTLQFILSILLVLFAPGYMKYFGWFGILGTLCFAIVQALAIPFIYKLISLFKADE